MTTTTTGVPGPGIPRDPGTTGPAAAVPIAPTVPPFSHPVVAARPPMNDTTRRLCAAAYLDDGYAFQVIDETTGDDLRAVPLSLGFDIEPVIRHSFRARRLLLVRDGVLAAILLAAFILLPLVTIGWLCFAWAVRRIRLVRRLRRAVLAGTTGGALSARIGSLHTRFAWAAILLSAVLYNCGAFVTPLLFLFGLGPSAQEQAAPAYSEEPSKLDQLGMRFGIAYNASLVILILLLPLIFAVVTAGFALFARIRTFRALTRTLAPGSPAPPPRLPSQRVQNRVGWLASAQRGNVSLHSKRPFMGAGDNVMLWSMALLLQGQPVRSGNGRHGEGEPPAERFGRDGTFDPRAVSALQMQHLVREAVLRLQDPELPPHQRVPGVYVMDRIIADGERFQGDPLIDQRSRTPLEMASPEAVAAIVENPQGGVRHYLHVLVGVEGREVKLRDGRLVVPPQSQDIIVSAHLHVAVEGGKLYVEFLGTVLPPVREEFNIVDRLRPELWQMLVRAAPGLLSDWANSIDAPVRLFRSLRQVFRTNQRARAAYADAVRFKSYDHGARLSVRELAAEDQPRTFLQDLDAFKYLKLVEKTVLATLLDHLERIGVDTSEYRTQMTHIQNTQTVLNSPNFNGPAAFGSGAFAQQVGVPA
jgi:hypothetical protein